MRENGSTTYLLNITSMIQDVGIKNDDEQK
jgi:hypothetical protein